MVSHQGGLIKVVFHQDGLSWGWSLIRVVFSVVCKCQWGASLQSISSAELSPSLKTGLTVNEQSYSAVKRAVTNMVHKVKSKYFFFEMAQKNCWKELFSNCDRLCDCKFDLPLPSTIPTCEHPDAFADYFVQNVKIIHYALDSQMPMLNLPIDGLFMESSFCSFDPV